MKTLKGLILLTRPVNAVICGLSVFCGAIIGDPISRIEGFFAVSQSGCPADMQFTRIQIISAVLSASLILAAGNVFNDVRDVATDRINMPHRPIPSGMVSATAASVFAAILAIAGLMLSIPLGTSGIAVAVFAVVVLAAYDIRLKSVPLAGNIAVSMLAGLAFIYGGIAGDAMERSAIPAIFAFLFHLGRELIKDAADSAGDRAAGLRTASTVWGEQTACRLAAFVLLMLAILTAAPYDFDFGYFLIIAVGVWPVLLYASISAVRNPSETNLRRISTILKLDMPVGIAAVIVGFM